MTEIIAQVVGIVAMIFNIFSYQCKNKRLLILMQFCGASLFCINYFLLGAYVGGMLNILSVIRAVVFLFKEKMRAEHIAWQIGFYICFFAVYLLSFTVFGTEKSAKNFIIELLPVLGMVVATIGYRLKNSAQIRKISIIASPLWLIYNSVVGSIGGIICESFALISIFVGILRHDIKKAE